MNLTKAEIVAAKLNKQLESTGLLICNYAKRFAIPKGAVFTADGNCLRVNGKGNAFIVDSFKAYVH